MYVTMYVTEREQWALTGNIEYSKLIITDIVQNEHDNRVLSFNGSKLTIKTRKQNKKEIEEYKWLGFICNDKKNLWM